MTARRSIRNAYAEAEQFKRRTIVSFITVFLSCIALMAWYFKLQYLDHQKYITSSDANRIKLRPVIPVRGRIYDRNGRLLAVNLPAFRLDVMPDKVPNMAEMLVQLRAIVTLSDEELERFERERKIRRHFLPVTLKTHLSNEDMARFAIERWRYPGVELEPYLTRFYPYGPGFAHVLGYVGRIDDKDLEISSVGTVAFGQTGKTCLERYYEAQLRGSIGYEQLETNVQGRAIRVIGRQAARPGMDLGLSIDADLQRTVIDAFGDYEGAAIAMDPRSGQILAMVSLPSFDPNQFVSGISHAEFEALNTDLSRPQFNRLVSGGVAPGSTLKPLIALAGLEAGVRRPDDKILSKGMFYLPGSTRGWGDANRAGHGWTDLRKSIAQSVNTYYYQLALDLGVDRFDALMQLYGLGKPTGVDLPGEIAGILPSPRYKLRTRHEAWFPGDTVNMAIGQGDWKVTLLQLVRGVSGIATGQLPRPHLVMLQRSNYLQPWQFVRQPPRLPIAEDMAHLEVVRAGMEDAMSAGGSAADAGTGASYRMAGKTGTAQVTSRRGTAAINPRSLPLHLRHRALFVGFAPVDHPTIAVAVAVEGGGYGASTAAPIGRKIFDAWILGKFPDGYVPLDQEQAATAIGTDSHDLDHVPLPAPPLPQGDLTQGLPIQIRQTLLTEMSQDPSL